MPGLTGYLAGRLRRTKGDRQQKAVTKRHPFCIISRRTTEDMKPRYIIAALIFALLAAYPLSFGPMVMIYNRQHNFGSYITVRQLDLFYEPISWASDHSTIFARAMNWYVRLWIGRDSPETH